MSGNKTRKFHEPKCRVCGCTEMNACNPPCAWAEPDLCTGCRDIAVALVEWERSAVKPNRHALRREVNRRERAPIAAGARE